MKEWLVVFAVLVVLAVIMYTFMYITCAIVWIAMQILMLGV